MALLLTISTVGIKSEHRCKFWDQLVQLHPDLESTKKLEETVPLFVKELYRLANRPNKYGSYTLFRNH